MLETFEFEGLGAENVTILGISAIAHAVIKGSPQLKRCGLIPSGSDHQIYRDMGMLQAAGREAVVDIEWSPEEY